jgi:hypothetical protein
MKPKTILLLWTSVLFLNSCTTRMDPLNLDGGWQTYFPMTVGNTWVFTYQSSTTTHTWKIVGSFPSQQESEQVHDPANSEHSYTVFLLQREEVTDTLQVFPNGDVYVVLRGIPYLWLAFSKNSGETYSFPFDGALTYQVSVSRNQTVTVGKRMFSGCVIFGFDVPQANDEEISYIFAPHVGPVRILTAWFSLQLNYAVLDGDTLHIR